MNKTILVIGILVILLAVPVLGELKAGTKIKYTYDPFFTATVVGIAPSGNVLIRFEEGGPAGQTWGEVTERSITANVDYTIIGQPPANAPAIQPVSVSGVVVDNGNTGTAKNAEAQRQAKPGDLISSDSGKRLAQGETVIDSNGKTHTVTDVLGSVYILEDGHAYLASDLAGWHYSTVSLIGSQPGAKPQAPEKTTTGEEATALKYSDIVGLLTPQALRDAINDKVVYYADKNGQIYIKSKTDLKPIPTNYVKADDGRFYNAAGNKMTYPGGEYSGETLIFDRTSGQMLVYTEGGWWWPSGWHALRDDQRNYNGNIVHRGYGLDLAGIDIFDRTYTLGGKDYRDFYYIKKNADGTESVTQLANPNELRDFIRNTMGSEFAKEAGNTVQEMINNVEKRRDAQAFWKGFVEGPDTLIGQSFSDQVNKWFGWSDAAKDSKILNSTIFTPERWEQYLCSHWFRKTKIPKSVQMGFDQYGFRTMTMNLFAEKEYFDALNQTLYQVTWVVSPISGKIKYTVCLNGCGGSCKIIQDEKEVDAGETESGFATKYRNETRSETAKKVAICYLQYDENGEDYERYSFSQPIVDENYRATGDQDASSYGSSSSGSGSGSDDSSTPDGAEGW